MEIRPTPMVDFSTILPFPGEGGGWITLVRNRRGEWVSLGPALGGRATASFGDSLLKGASQVVRFDNEGDGTPELLVITATGEARVLTGPVRKGTMDVEKEGFRIGAGGYDPGAAISDEWVALTRDFYTIEIFRKPLSPNQAPEVSWELDARQSAVHCGSSILCVRWSPDGTYTEILLLEPLSGPSQLGSVPPSRFGRTGGLVIGPVGGASASNVVAWYWEGGTQTTVVFQDGLRGTLDAAPSQVLWTYTANRSPLQLVEHDGRTELWMSDDSFVRLPTEPGFPPYVQIEDLKDLAWVDLDGDGRDEWLGIDNTIQDPGEPARGYTVLPGNWP